jgi:hypothetical protein
MNKKKLNEKKDEKKLFTTKNYVSIQTLPFTIERYVSTKTPHVHFQEVCSH